MSSETCMIFVDDSNVWIEAQKFAASGNSHMPKLQDSDRDPRLRTDIGKLVRRLRRNRRTQGPSFLYGSRPPPNDSVWRAFEKNQFETHIYDRAYGGKEKEVDNSMSVGMAKRATRLQVEVELRSESGDPKAAEKRDKTIFVVVTGDRDMMPAVKLVLECNIRVELWGWKSGISQAYLDLAAKENDLLSLHLLDSIFEDICFTAYRSTRKVKSVIGGKTMVLQNVDDSNENAICDRLLEIRQLFYYTRWDGALDLCIEFPNAGQNQMENLIIQARKLLPYNTILSWPEYSTGFRNKERTDKLKTVNMYGLLDPTSAAGDGHSDITKFEEQLQDLTLKDPIEHDDLSTDVGGDSSADGWKTVVNKIDSGKRHRRVVNQQQDCPDGLRCKKQEDCSYRHTAKERQLFQQNPNRKLALHKTQRCRYAPNCWRGRDCLYAHTDAEARCLDCKQIGHFQGDSAKCLLHT
jgi:hypothetical protein